jgi:transforming growth factor-beta-induced protein
MTHFFQRIGIAATLASTVALTACGSDDDESTGGSGAVSGGSTASGGDAGSPTGTGGSAATGGEGGGSDGEAGAAAVGGEGGVAPALGGAGGMAPAMGGEGGMAPALAGAGGMVPAMGGEGGMAPALAGAGGSSGMHGEAGAHHQGGSAGAATGEPTLLELATAAGNFTSLIAAVDQASLTAALDAEGPFTVFAPTDEAFAAFEAENPGVLASLSDAELAAILTYHVVAGEVLSTDLVSGALVTTLNGARAAVDLSEGATIAGAHVVQADLMASNGVIHVVDRLMLPPSLDLVETAVAAGNFTTLAGALVATGLDETLQGDGPFTVFAPTDEAFAAFEADNPGVLAGLTNAELTDVLLYHVVPGWAGPADLSDGMLVPTALDGSSLTITLGDGVQVNDANVTSANIVTTNGVIHVIDAVLLPPSG